MVSYRRGAALKDGISASTFASLRVMKEWNSLSFPCLLATPPPAESVSLPVSPTSDQVFIESDKPRFVPDRVWVVPEME